MDLEPNRPVFDWPAMDLEPNRPVFDWPLGAGTPGNEVWFLFLTAPDGETLFWYHIELCSTGETQSGWAWAAVIDRDANEDRRARRGRRVAAPWE